MWNDYQKKQIHKLEGNARIGNWELELPFQKLATIGVGEEDGLGLSLSDPPCGASIFNGSGSLGFDFFFFLCVCVFLSICNYEDFNLVGSDGSERALALSIMVLFLFLIFLGSGFPSDLNI